jgi:hypothetical protein
MVTRQRRLLLAHVGWIAVVALGVVIFVSGLPVYYMNAQTACSAQIPMSGCLSLSPVLFGALAHLGISSTGVAAGKQALSFTALPATRRCASPFYLHVERREQMSAEYWSIA